MTTFTGGMEDICSACGREVGEHTMREFSACTDSRRHVIEYGDASQALRDRFNLPDDVLPADHVVAKATVLSGDAGPLKIAAPGLLLEFASSGTGRVEPVVKVLFFGDSQTMRAMGRLLRDTANGAANAADRMAA